MRKKFGRVAAVAVALELFAGTVGSVYAAESVAEEAADDAAIDEAAADDADKITITIFTNYEPTNPESVAKNFNKALQKTIENFPQYNIEYSSAAIEDYKTQIKEIVPSKDCPDIFMSYGAGFIRTFVNGNHVEPLNDYITTEAKSRMLVENYDMFLIDGGIYGLTSSKWVGALYCNQAMFEEHNVKIPETFEELLDACKIFRAAEITPIALGEKDKWPGQQFVNELTIQLAGAKGTNRMATKEEPTFYNLYISEAADHVLELIRAGAFADDALDTVNEDAYAAFTAGETPMLYTNSFYSDQAYSEGSAIADTVTAVRFPLLDGADPTQYFGGAIDGLCLSSKSGHKEEAYEVLEYLSYQWACEDGGLVTWAVPEESKASVSELDQTIIDYSSNGKGFALAWDTILEDQDVQPWLDTCRELYAGTITSGDAFAEKLQELIGS